MARGVVVLVLILSSGLSGCIFEEDEPYVPDPRIRGYTLEELEAGFERTTDRVLGLDDLPRQSLVVIEVVPESDPEALNDVVTFRIPLDTPAAETPDNFCGEFRSHNAIWGATTADGALVVREDPVPPAEIRYDAPATRFSRVTVPGGASLEMRPYFVLFGVDDVGAWKAAGADASYHIEGGAVWWRIVEEGTLRCVFQPSDHDEGAVVQSDGATRATGMRSSFEASGQATLELLWRAQTVTLSLQHNETELFRQTENGGGGRMVAPLAPGRYDVRYDDLFQVVGSAYAGFVVRDIDASLVQRGQDPYWAVWFDDAEWL